MNGRQEQFRPEGMGRPGMDMQPRRFAPRDTDQADQPMQHRSEGWTPGMGPGRRQGMGPGWMMRDPQPEKTPDTNAPDEPVAKEQIEKPLDE
jgi:hypothetical protein